MNPQIALMLVLAFIFFAIYIEHKRSEGISGAVWIIAIWILYSVSKGLGFFFQVQTTIEQGSPYDRNFLLFLGALATIILIKRKFPIITMLKSNWIVLLIITYMLISVAWSQFPAISFRRWGREAIALIIALLLASENNPIQTLTSAFKKSIYAALPLSILLIKYYPVYGREYGRWSGELLWTGIASQKNGLAMLCAISILFLLWSTWQDLKKSNEYKLSLVFFIDIFMIILATYLMMGPQHSLTYSATSFLALITGIIVMLSVRIASKKEVKMNKIIIISAVIVIFIGISMPFSGKLPSTTLPRILNRSETLTDRTLIWSSLVPQAKQKILLGHGYGSFWTTELRSQIASHAHNGYLDTILELGLTGLILFVFYLLKLIQKSSSFIKNNAFSAFFFLSLIFIIIMRGITESPLGEFDSLSMWLVLCWSFIINTKEDILINPEKEMPG
ncbi:MAG: O-antigen ligase family protein [Candidatus Saccharicenans sp.]|nr:O-antigen ligase family protein [Candidatus Saccharicenans sp.]MDI6848899.1 O-antigen ligase family protein [Candidatus Saccharicenans sp.]